MRVEAVDVRCKDRTLGSAEFPVTFSPRCGSLLARLRLPDAPTATKNSLMHCAPHSVLNAEITATVHSILAV